MYGNITVVYSNPDSDSNPDSTCIVTDIVSFHSFSHYSHNTSCVDLNVFDCCFVFVIV